MRSGGKGLMLLGALLVGAFAFLKPRKGLALTIGPVRIDRRLSRNFLLSEFLHSVYAPTLGSYKPSEEEIGRVLRHVALQLQPLRDKYGRLVITSGARPDSVAAKGPKSGAPMSITKAMQEAGDDAADNSDHRLMVLGVSDFTLPEATPGQIMTAYQELKADPNTRQVILYTVGGKFDHFHLATVQPGFPRLDERNRAFVNVDGKHAVDMEVA